MDRILNKFEKYIGCKISIYGIGDNARNLIENFNGFRFVSLIAKDHIGEEKYGLKILSIEDAVKEAEVIIIAASFSATSIIYSRIKDIVPRSMPVLNMFGENLSDKDPCESDSYWNESYEKLLEAIDTHEVISFDIFDTLIMRDTLNPSDIFRIVADKSDTPEFVSVRIDSEKRCRSNGGEPTLDDIYNYIEKNELLSSASIEDLKRLEISTEIEHILPRKRMVAALEYAIKSGKKVYLTSDMYLSKDEMATLLHKCGIDGGYELLVSCECGCSKFSGELYDLLKEKAGTTDILHIGDDELVDMIKARERGVAPYLIRSSYGMLANSSAAFLFDEVQNSEDKNYLGYYIAEVLNDPFAMFDNNGKIKISSERDIALLVFPITKLFIDFIIRNASDYDCVLFPSRDGFFLYNEYCKYKDEHPDTNLPDAKYIHASRMALSRAALKDEKTFDVLIHKLYSNLSKNCKKYISDLFDYNLPEEFDRSVGDLIEQWGKEALIDNLNRHVPDMVKELQGSSDNYLKYIDTLGVPQYERIAMVDIVSYGTQPYCLSEILGKPVDMVSIGATGIPNVFLKENRARTIYGNINEEINGAIMNNSDLSVLHLLLEVLYSSRNGQFLEISDLGEAKCANGSEYNKDLLDGVQKELDDLLKRYGALKSSVADFSPDFCHGMLRVLRKRYSIIAEELGRKFIFSDPYDGGFASVNLTDSL